MFTVNNFDLLEVLAYIFLWTTIYFILCLWNSSRSFEWHCRIVTTVHALVISFLAFYCTFRVGPSPFTDAGKVAVLMEVIIFCIVCRILWLKDEVVVYAHSYLQKLCDCFIISTSCGWSHVKRHLNHPHTKTRLIAGHSLVMGGRNCCHRHRPQTHRCGSSSFHCFILFLTFDACRSS